MSSQPEEPRQPYEPETTILATFEEDYPTPLPDSWRDYQPTSKRYARNRAAAKAAEKEDELEAFDRMLGEQACFDYEETKKLTPTEEEPRVKREEDLFDEYLAE